ncbi:thrombospondin-2-like [Mercenaria mercenaria]|uniref:thrombospondin-2-like n=1 Tax=Mercenaria mercenaria TaxID=6596 RepID=UPI00234E766F|nr:thrombospondin-2-like [Mercenaria mercenaria]
MTDSIVLRSVIFCAAIASAFLEEDATCQRTLEDKVKLDPCPVNGNWAQWGNWQGCSTTCGPGLTRRTRTCSNPKPSMLGNDCQGDETDYKLCFNDNPCQINGFWSEWSAWNCYIFGGKRVRQRSCYGPMFGGVDCPPGNKTEFKIDTSCH